MASILIIDDETTLARNAARFLEKGGHGATTASTGREGLKLFGELRPDAVVLDFRLPDMDGLAVIAAIRADDTQVPIIMITGHGSIELAVEAMKAGAVDFLQKPFRDQPFLDAIERAVELSRAHHAASQRSQEARAILTRLSPRETEVARWLALGWANKAIARQLAISEHTVHVHRQHIMDKTDAGSPADLARLILRADPAGLDEAGMAAN